jgi:hypothetical protein
MNVTIDLSEQNAAALEARAAHMAPANYLSQIVEKALHNHPVEETLKPRKSAYGLLAQYGPGPTQEEIDQNRREIFSGFGELVP